MLKLTISRQAHAAGCSVTTLMANNDSLLETGPSPASSISFSPKANEIFHCEATSTKLPGLKRKIVGGDTDNNIRAKISCSSSNSMISPPLFKPRPNLAMVPGYPHEANTNQENAANQEDEWKNIRVVS